MIASLAPVPRYILIGIAQIMFQPSALVGAAFVVGMLINSHILAMFGLIGCLFSTVLAIVLKFPEEEISTGLYGFNGALVGLGIGYFFGTYPVLLIAVVVGAGVSAVIMYQMLRRGFVPFTFPFVVTTWAVMLVFWVMGWAPLPPSSTPGSDTLEPVNALARGYGQILFQEHAVTGLIFVAAIAVRDWVQGLFATLATILGIVLAYLLGFPIDAVNLGLFGYSGVLCAILFAGRSGMNILQALVAIVMSILIVRLFHVIGQPALTFPFVISAWLVMYGRKVLPVSKSQ